MENSHTYEIDYQQENYDTDYLAQAISYELLCAELLNLKQSLLVAIDPSLKDVIDLKFLEDENYVENLINSHLSLSKEGATSSASEIRHRLDKAQLLYRDLNEEIEWLTRNSLMINRVFSPKTKKSQKEDESEIENINAHKNHHILEEEDSNKMAAGSALWTELLCLELLALRDAIFVVLSPSLRNLLDVRFFQDSSSTQRVMDIFFDTTAEHSSFMNNRKRWKESELFHQDLHHQIKWLVMNAKMIQKGKVPTITTEGK